MCVCVESESVIFVLCNCMCMHACVQRGCVCVCVCFLSLPALLACVSDPLEALQSRSCETTTGSLLTGAGPIMAPKLNVLLLLLVVAAVTVLGQRRRTASTAKADEWNFRDGSEKVNMRGVANLTQILDNWRFDILNQMRGLLQNDHQSLLPDYSRIQPLSEALDDLYKEFNALKAHLGDLTEKFSAIETFIDEVKAERVTKANAGPAPGPDPAPVPRQTGRRLVKKKATS